MDIFTHLAAGALAVAGAVSIYLGYRLFCYSRGWYTLAAGALLALLGMGLLVADVRNPAVPQRRPEWQRQLKIQRQTLHRYQEFFV